MVTEHGIQFAVHIISTFHGDTFSVNSIIPLLRRGTITLPQIIHFTELPRPKVEKCLRILILHNSVQAFNLQQQDALGEEPKMVTHYMAIFDNIIHRWRAEKFMQIVSDELGKDCLEVFEVLVQHGRLSLEHILDRHKQITGGSDVDVAQESFNRLLSARFIERCPAPDPYLEPPADGETAKRRGAKSKVAEVRLTTEQRALAAAAPMDSMRFSMDMDDISEEMGEKSPKSTTVGKKRKEEVVYSDEDVSDGSKKKEILWRVNFEEFLRLMRNKACISYVKTNINPEAGIVLSAMLKLSGRSETRQKAEKSPYLSLNAIYEELLNEEEDIGMDLARTKALLEQLGCQTLSTGLDDSFSIDIKGIIEMAQTEEVESVVFRRHGREAYRIFRLLTKAGRCIESDEISDKTFVEKKDAVKILYDLWKENYVHMEKVSTTGVKQTWYLLWRVNKEPLLQHFLDEMYHAALNLRLRIAHEQEQEKEVLQLPREKLVGELEKKYKTLGTVRVILESSLLNLDDAIMLFNDF